MDARVGDVFSDLSVVAWPGPARQRSDGVQTDARVGGGGAKTRVDAATQTCTFIEPEEEVDVDKAVEDVEGGVSSKVSLNYAVMSAEEAGYA